MNYSIVSSTNIVTLEEVKLYCRIDNNAEDALLSALIEAAQTHVREFTGRIPYATVIDFSFANWSNVKPYATSVEALMINGGCGQSLPLPFSTASSVVVYYKDSNGTEQTINSSNYTLLDLHSVSTIVFKPSYSLPTLDTNSVLPIRIRATYSTSAKEHNAFKILVMSLVLYWYTNREPVATGTIATKLPYTFDVLANSIKRGDCFL